MMKSGSMAQKSRQAETITETTPSVVICGMTNIYKQRYDLNRKFLFLRLTRPISTFHFHPLSPIAHFKSSYLLTNLSKLIQENVLFVIRQAFNKRDRLKSNFVWNSTFRLKIQALGVVFKFIWCVEHVQMKMLSNHRRRKKRAGNFQCIFYVLPKNPDNHCKCVKDKQPFEAHQQLKRKKKTTIESMGVGVGGAHRAVHSSSYQNR